MTHKKINIPKKVGATVVADAADSVVAAGLPPKSEPNAGADAVLGNVGAVVLAVVCVGVPKIGAVPVAVVPLAVVAAG